MVMAVACGRPTTGDAPIDAQTGGDAAGASDAAPVCDPGAWREEALPDEGLVVTDVRGLHGTADDDVWAVTHAGRVLHRVRGGWTQPAALTVPLNAVWAAASDNVWVAGRFGFISHWNGTGWETERSTDDTGLVILELNDIHAASAAQVWAVGELAFGEPVVLHREGGRWLVAVPPDTNQKLNAVWAVGPDHIWVAGDDGLYELVDGEWTRRAVGAYRDVVVLPSGELWTLKLALNGKPLCHSFASTGACEAFPDSSLAFGVGFAVIDDTIIAVATDGPTGMTLVGDLRDSTWHAGALRESATAYAVWGTATHAWIGVSTGVRIRGCD